MKMHRLRVACVWLCLQVLLATMRTVVALPVSGVADSRSNDRALSPAPALTQLQLQAAAGGKRDRNRRTAAESSSSSEDDDSPAMQYVKRLKDSLTDADGNPLVSEDDPTSVWCFLDKGEYRKPPVHKKDGHGSYKVVLPSVTVSNRPCNTEMGTGILLCERGRRDETYYMHARDIYTALKTSIFWPALYT